MSLATITLITNECICESLEFDCNTCTDRGIRTKNFNPFGRTWKNESFNYKNRSGGYSTCMLEEIRTVQAEFFIYEKDPIKRMDTFQEFRRVLTNYDCCSNCCPIRIDYQTVDGNNYYFKAKVGGEVINDKYQDTDIIKYQVTFEICGNVQKNTVCEECCGELTELGWTPGILPISYEPCDATYIPIIGNVCADFCLCINTTEPASNITVHVNDSIYGMQTDLLGELFIDTEAGTATVNGDILGFDDRIPGSSIRGIKMKPGLNKVYVTGQGEAKWCIRYSNDIA